MNLPNQQLEDFFNGTPLGKRLLAEAKRSQAEFDSKLNEIRGSINTLQQNIEYATYGQAHTRNAQTVLYFSGNPVLIKTDNRSRVTSYEPITNENWKGLDPNVQQDVKGSNPVAFQRLQHGKFTINDDDTYFLNLARADAGLNVDVLNAYATMKQPNERDYSKQFDSPEDMENGVLSFHKWHNAMTTDQNIADLHAELRAYEKNLDESIKANEILPFDVSAIEGEQAGAFGVTAE
ncbi:hypothetical protein I6G76_02585 [Bacillus cereus]|uniref:Uncharacterized protein n=1 Tax=Bacillus cereus (strain ZK / E33L) TaxID=288681 RepID=Q633W2_BACCZ|nr:hypothetical protein [Bacillus cereus]AAU16044.1 hypothetical protein BCE33L4226 [Bacillus cereus E33L]AJI29256.1 hypothetical protein BF28_1190 [Bacillus cereus E33L]MDA1808903.1 hypothetical protein [Bacillus cereus]QQA21885.1 hypothetical protein I6G76_02585 [Bacillus cereus]TBX91491.1 hypothetical protein E0M29_13225 [Bacillus cereus]